jgi:hypothetical protein
VSAMSFWVLMLVTFLVIFVLRSWWLGLLHVHYDRDWQLVGVHVYEQCRCGARKTTHAVAGLDGPSAVGWPYRRNRHGVLHRSSGWQMPPDGGWRVAGYPARLAPPTPINERHEDTR